MSFEKSAPLNPEQQASDFTTSPEILRQLATHEDPSVRRAIAANPNTPIDALSRLGAEFPKEFWENSLLPLLLMEDPNLFSTIPIETMERLLNRRDLPGKILEDFAKAGSAHVQERVARNRATPPGALAELAKRTNAKTVLWEVAENPNTPPEALDALLALHTTNYAMHNRIAANPSTKRETRWRMFSSYGGYGHDCEALLPAEWVALFKRAQSLYYGRLDNKCKEFSFTPEERSLLLTGGPSARCFVVADLHCPLEVLYQVARDPKHEGSGDLLSLLLRHPNATPQLWEEIASHPEAYTRAELAKSPQAPEEFLRKLSRDKEPLVLFYVAENPNTPLDCLEMLAKQPSVREFVARNPRATDALLRSLGSDSRVESSLVIRAVCPEDIWLRLAQSVSGYILENLSKNPRLPASVFELLVQNQKSTSHLEYLIENSATPFALIEKLKAQEKLFLRAASSTAREELQQLIATFSDWKVRLELAGSKQALPHVLEKLVNDKAASVKKAAMQNPNTPRKAKKAAPKKPTKKT